MSSRYDRNRSRREIERQRSLMGETFAQFKARERGDTGARLGDHLPRARCRDTGDLFNQQRQLFDTISKEED